MLCFASVAPYYSIGLGVDKVSLRGLLFTVVACQLRSMASVLFTPCYTCHQLEILPRALTSNEIDHSELEPTCVVCQPPEGTLSSTPSGVLDTWSGQAKALYTLFAMMYRDMVRCYLRAFR